MPENRLNSSTRNIVKDRIKVSRVKRKVLRNYKLVRIFLILLLFGMILWSYFTYSFISKRVTNSELFQVAKSFVFTPSETFPANSGRVNILLLGINQEDPNTPDLTDTMLVLSIPTGAGKIAIVSIPRDIWINSLGDRINSAYHWGNLKKPGGGMMLAQSTVEQIFGSSVSNTVVFDEDVFKKVVDLVGGIDVNVENSFTDPMYPISGLANADCNGDPLFLCRYKTIQFTKGLTHMDGETALIFVRSRHAKGIEGSDIAREARQQLVILALKNKLEDKKYNSDPKILLGLFNIAKTSVLTNLTLTQMAYLVRKIINLRQYTTYLIPQEFLITPSPRQYYGAIVFIPRSGSWDEVKKWFAQITSNN